MIIKAIRKPSQIEAIQFTGKNHKDLYEFSGKYIIPHDEKPQLMTHQGRKDIQKNDYLVKEEGRKEGLYYLMKEVDFVSTFDIIKEKAGKEKKEATEEVNG